MTASLRVRGATIDAVLEIADDSPDSSALAVQRLGDGKLRVFGGGTSGKEGRALLEWLRTEHDVVDVSFRVESGSIEVQYQSAKSDSNAFIRRLRDRIFVIEQRPLQNHTHHIEVVHALEGRVRLRLTGGTDEDVQHVANLLTSQTGIIRASASPASRSVLVQYDEALITRDAIVRAASSHDAELAEIKALAKPRSQWKLTAFNSLVLGAALTQAAPPLAIGAFVAVTAAPSARRAIAALRERRASVDLLDLAAVGISVATGQPATAALITWLLGVGDLVLEHTHDRARTAISHLMKLDATEAWRLGPTGDVEKVDVKKLGVGDRIVIEAGGRVAADGIIRSGSASLDEKALTGESLPHDKHEGDRVLAATVVVDGQIVVEIERAGGDTTAAKIVQILEGAGSKPMTLQRETERVADRLVLPTFALAGGAAFLTSQITRATSVLITDFGTGIRIAVPTSALAAMTMAARRGVLVKGGQFLERMSKVDTIVFDKTGTLTGGCPEVFEVRAFNNFTSREAIALAASAEARQHHPIADSLRRHAIKMEVTVVEAELGSESFAIGRGLVARVRGKRVMVGSARWMDEQRISLSEARAVLAQHHEAAASSIVVAVDGELAAVVGYADAPRAESKAVVSALKQGDRRSIVLLSGDSRGPVESVGRAVGVDRAIGELMPDEKARVVKELQAEGKIVAMIGDGINDAPALAVADVGISLEGGTDVALETADVVLLEGGLAKLPLAFDVADEAMAHVRRGLGIVIAPNAAAIALGALGLITPGVAAAINNGSTVIAALAALTPLFKKEKR